MAETVWTYTIQDFSPLLEYSGSTNQTTGLNPAWQQSCPSGNAAITPGIFGPSTTVTICDLSSVHTTSVEGATVSVSFYGQSIQFLGGVTSGMSYKVTIDGSTENGSPVDSILATIDNLSPGNHTASITASPMSSGSALSFDGAVVTVGTGLTGANVVRSVVQDDDSSLIYTLASSWFSDAFDSYGIQHALSNKTWHQVNAATVGSVRIPFTGQAILVYGVSRSWSNSPYTVSLDDQPRTTLYGNAALSSSQPNAMFTDGLLFSHANLSGGPHTLVMDNADGNGVVALDYVEIITISGGSPFQGSTSGSSGSPFSPPPVHSSSHKSQLKLGIILGPVFGAIMLLLVLAAAFFIHRRRVRKAYLKGLENAMPTTFDATFALPSPTRPAKTMSGLASDGDPSLATPSMPIQREGWPRLTSTALSTPPPPAAPMTPVTPRRREGPRSTTPSTTSIPRPPATPTTPITPRRREGQQPLGPSAVLPSVAPTTEEQQVIDIVPQPATLEGGQQQQEPMGRPSAAQNYQGELEEELRTVQRLVARDPAELSQRLPARGSGSESSRDIRSTLWRIVDRLQEVLDPPPDYES